MIAFCEERKLSDLATGLKSELKMIRKSSSATLKPLNRAGSSSTNVKAAAGKETAGMDEKGQKRTLKVIMNALRSDERNKKREEVKKIVRKSGTSNYEPPPKRPDPDEQNFNKEENEEIMEGLMNKIVVNPKFVNDERLNSKIEGIIGMEAFQKMVDNADVFQDISNTSLFNQSEFLQKSMNNALNSFQKLLPTHS